MIYSSFDWGSGKYRVFQDTRVHPIMADPKTCAPPYRGGIGIDINSALCSVPSDAKFVGWSDVAKGQVSSYGSPPSTHSSRAPNLGNVGLGFLGQTTPLALHDAVVYSAIISIISGLISTWFFKNVQVPVKKGV